MPKRIEETAISVNEAVLMSYQVKEKQTKDKRGEERGWKEEDTCVESLTCTDST